MPQISLGNLGGDYIAPTQGVWMGSVRRTAWVGDSPRTRQLTVFHQYLQSAVLCAFVDRTLWAGSIYVNGKEIELLAFIQEYAGEVQIGSEYPRAFVEANEAWWNYIGESAGLQSEFERLYPRYVT